MCDNLTHTARLLRQRHEKEVAELVTGVEELREAVNGRLEPIVDSMRMDVVMLSQQKHFFF